MESYIVKIISVDKVTHDVLKIVLEKPTGYTFKPGPPPMIDAVQGFFCNLGVQDDAVVVEV